jgi:hypothetical protein
VKQVKYFEESEVYDAVLLDDRYPVYLCESNVYFVAVDQVPDEEGTYTDQPGSEFVVLGRLKDSGSISLDQIAEKLMSMSAFELLQHFDHYSINAFKLFN